eukprot:sb/3465875/
MIRVLKCLGVSVFLLAALVIGNFLWVFLRVPQFTGSRFTGSIIFPRNRKLTVFDPDIPGTPIYRAKPFTPSIPVNRGPTVHESHVYNGHGLCIAVYPKQRVRSGNKLKDYYTFTFVRDPLVRLVSAWRDKFQHHPKENRYIQSDPGLVAPIYRAPRFTWQNPFPEHSGKSGSDCRLEMECQASSVRLVRLRQSDYVNFHHKYGRQIIRRFRPEEKITPQDLERGFPVSFNEYIDYITSFSDLYLYARGLNHDTDIEGRESLACTQTNVKNIKPINTHSTARKYTLSHTSLLYITHIQHSSASPLITLISLSSHSLQVSLIFSHSLLYSPHSLIALGLITLHQASLVSPTNPSPNHKQTESTRSGSGL